MLYCCEAKLVLTSCSMMLSALLLQKSTAISCCICRPSLDAFFRAMNTGTNLAISDCDSRTNSPYCEPGMENKHKPVIKGWLHPLLANCVQKNIFYCIKQIGKLSAGIQSALLNRTNINLVIIYRSVRHVALCTHLQGGALRKLRYHALSSARTQRK